MEERDANRKTRPRELTRTITRRETFSASHRLQQCGTPSQSRRNDELFGKCARRHGHNYVVEVSFRGAVNERTGMLIDMAVAKRCIQEAVLDVMDHADIDDDVPEFRERPSTVENIAEAIFLRLDALPELQRILYKVKLWETEKISASVKRRGS
uniref:6-pyruvoyltetrahydropterin synthase n=1 Tax=Erythrolobus australicus TaxID=1077150 RepID=A0A7S1TJU1_9RHOD|mmetsp:Transcript_2003/g.5316  ORF Transcript_2003/g.5316 Transcript_2003/m.5316 type:complete len:154 (+) Transcript_2003:755-1216(+)